MFKRMWNSVYALRYSFRKLLVFSSFYLMLTSFLFVPIISYIFNRMLRAIGSNVLLNNEVYRIWLSYEGMIGLALIVMLAVLIIFLQLGVVLILTQQKLFGKDVTVADALLTTVRAVPKLLNISLIQLIIVLIVLLPFIETPLTRALLVNINLPIFVTNKLNGSLLLLALYGLLILLALYLFLRWMFAFHFILIDGLSTRKALKASYLLTQGKKGRILLQLLLFNVGLLITGFLLVTAGSALIHLLEPSAFRFALDDLYIAVTSFLSYMLTLLLIPVNVIYVTKLYYLFRKVQGQRPADRLKLIHSGPLSRMESRIAAYMRNRIKRFTLVLMIIVYFSGGFVLNQTFSSNLVYLKWNVMVAAHRGDLNVAPENSLSSIRSAIEKNVDAVEIDVQMTRDGIVVLSHDYTLRRTAGVPQSVHELTYEELSALEIGSSFSPEFAGERIPSLVEALREMKEKTRVIVEIKPYGDVLELARRTAEIIEQLEMVGDAYVQSFDYQVLQEVRRVNPDIRIGQILFLAAGRLSELDVDFYTVEQSMLSDRFIENAHRADREVWVWTVNLSRNIQEVLKYDIDGIITDYPERVQTYIQIGLTSAGEASSDELTLQQLPQEGG